MFRDKHVYKQIHGRLYIKYTGIDGGSRWDWQRGAGHMGLQRKAGLRIMIIGHELRLGLIMSTPEQ